MKQKNFSAFVWANLKLQKNDFWQLPLAQVGLTALTAGVLTAIAFFIEDTEPLTIGVPGVIAVAIAVLCGFIQGIGRILLEYRVGVQMSIPRRRMFAASLALCLVSAAEGLATAWLLNRLWIAVTTPLLATAAPMQDLLGYIPAMGWVALLLAPSSFGMLAGAIILRFGRRGGWLMYFLFLGCCYLPAAGSDWLTAHPAVEHWLEGIVPLLLPAAAGLSVAFMAASWLLLRRQSVE